MFDDLPADELAAASAQTAEAGLAAARLVAAKRLAAGPASGVGRPAALVALLMARDQADPRWERLWPYEQAWSLLVLRIAAPVMDPVTAVGDARWRGVTWVGIATALGTSAQAAQQRFGSRLSR